MISNFFSRWMLGAGLLLLFSVTLSVKGDGDTDKASSARIVRGDLDKNGRLDAGDIVVAAQALAGTDSRLTWIELRQIGDLNSDGSFDRNDLRLLIRLVEVKYAQAKASRGASDRSVAKQMLVRQQEPDKLQRRRRRSNRLPRRIAGTEANVPPKANPQARSDKDPEKAQTDEGTSTQNDTIATASVFGVGEVESSQTAQIFHGDLDKNGRLDAGDIVLGSQPRHQPGKFIELCSRLTSQELRQYGDMNGDGPFDKKDLRLRISQIEANTAAKENSRVRAPEAKPKHVQVDAGESEPTQSGPVSSTSTPNTQAFDSPAPEPAAMTGSAPDDGQADSRQAEQILPEDVQNNAGDMAAGLEQEPDQGHLEDGEPARHHTEAAAAPIVHRVSTPDGEPNEGQADASASVRSQTEAVVARVVAPAPPAFDSPASEPSVMTGSAPDDGQADSRQAEQILPEDIQNNAGEMAAGLEKEPDQEHPEGGELARSQTESAAAPIVHRVSTPDGEPNEGQAGASVSARSQTESAMARVIAPEPQAFDSPAPVKEHVAIERELTIDPPATQVDAPHKEIQGDDWEYESTTERTRNDSEGFQSLTDIDDELVQKILSYINIGMSSKDASKRHVGRDIERLGWHGFVQGEIKTQLEWGVRRFHIRYPFGARKHVAPQADEYLEAKEAGLTWLTEGFVEAWKPVIQGAYTNGEPVEVITYFGSLRTDQDFERLREAHDLEGWFERAWASIEPALQAGASIAFDSLMPAAADHPCYEFCLQLKNRGVRVYIETWPWKKCAHWGSFNIFVNERLYEKIPGHQKKYLTRDQIKGEVIRFDNRREIVMDQPIEKVSKIISGNYSASVKIRLMMADVQMQDVIAAARTIRFALTD